MGAVVPQLQYPSCRMCRLIKYRYRHQHRSGTYTYVYGVFNSLPARTFCCFYEHMGGKPKRLGRRCLSFPIF